MNCHKIGIVKSPVKDMVDEGWGAIISEIEVDKKLAPGLRGLESFSHVIVIFEMHESSWDPEHDLVRHPQGRPDLPLVGIFSQRAKHRPNPIGISSVRLLSVEGNVITVKGLDAIDGTRVLDIKPYFPQYDCITDAHYPEWVEKLMQGYF